MSIKPGELQLHKEPIAFGLSLAVCIYWPLDLVSVILKSGEVTLFGEILTAGVIAGGSKASMKLFVDLMGVQSQAAKAQKAVQDAAAAPVRNDALVFTIAKVVCDCAGGVCCLLFCPSGVR
ncbi:MAG: hypothetical protein GY789_19850 [Hyphomicrobiales bacterium]|nr:hypothetical protein [Hyphomicrobiales bacterium]